VPSSLHLSASPGLEPAAVGAQQTAPADVPQQGNWRHQERTVMVQKKPKGKKMAYLTVLEILKGHPREMVKSKAVKECMNELYR
jgi:hypothetical protein